MPEIKLIITEDGSHTLFHSVKNENYHSIHGAITETQHVFINQGFVKATESFSGISILEVGFGTGLNALLTLEFSFRKKIPVNYTTYEPFPLSEELIKNLNYTETDPCRLLKKEFLAMHSAKDGSLLPLTEGFSFTRFNRMLQSGLPESSRYNLVYFDAFSPEAEPDLWTHEIFGLIRGNMIPGGVLVTYSARGAVRRALQATGFKVERLPGPPGKREMLRAIAISEM